jgi:hypothetical protein
MDSQGTTMEAAYKLLCRKLWLHAKPSELEKKKTLSPNELELLSILFPRPGKGRKATGVGGDSWCIESTYDIRYKECLAQGMEEKTAKKEAMKAAEQCCKDFGIYKTRDAIRKDIERNKAACKARRKRTVSEEAQEIRRSIDRTYEKAVIKASLQEVKELLDK